MKLLYLNKSFLSLADPEVKDILLSAANNEQTREMSHAVLAVCTGDKQHWDAVEAVLAEGSTLDYVVVKYLKENADKSAEVEKILRLNDEIYQKKMQKNNEDNDD